MKRSQVQGKFTTPRPRQVLATRFERRGGFSLIEVAIAMAIFVFGALAIVRVFPGALNVVQDSEQRAIGQRMAQSTLATFNAQPRTVPAALFDTNSNLDATTARWSDFPGAVYGTNSDDNLSLAQAAPEPGDLDSANSFLNQSAMGHFRRVSGETHRVPANGEVLLNFPYLSARDSVAFNAALNPVIKIRREVEGVFLNAGGDLDFSNARVNGLPFSEAAPNQKRPPETSGFYAVPDVATPRRADTIFYISYNWTTGGYTNGVQNEPKKFPDITWTAGDVSQAQVLQHKPAAGQQVVPGAVKVWFYQSYRLPEAQQGNLDYDPNLGRVVNLPALAATPPITNGQMVSIDYTVPDWRFIVTDNTLSTQISDSDVTYLQDQGLTPGANNNVVQLVLPTRYVADEPIGDANAQLYALLRGRTNTGATVVSRAAWSPNFTATTEPANVRQADANNAKPVAVRPKTGQVFFDTNALAAPSNPLISPTARVVYRNIEGWVQQPAIAASSYLPYTETYPAGTTAALFPREPWREYFYLPNNDEKRIFFHASEAGKSLTVSYVYQDGGNFITMRDVPVPIEANVETRPAAVPATFNGRYLLNGTATDCDKISFAYLRDNQGRSIGAPVGNGGNNTAQIVAISEVRGASIRVRSGWYNGDRYTQTSVVGYRPLDVESYNRS